MAKNIIVFSKVLFDEFCSKRGYNDSNIESVNNFAFISIVGTENCQKYYLNEVEEHFFKKNHSNVINLEFDDIDHDIDYYGHKLLSMSDDQAGDLFKFIENNIDKTFIIHCRAGMSRSGAVGQFIFSMYNAHNKLIAKNKANGRIMPNINVLTLLKKQYYIKYGIPFT